MFNNVSSTYGRTIPGGFNKIRGRRYAWGLLIVTSAATPTVAGRNAGASGFADIMLGRSPRIAGQISGLTDLPSSFLASAVGNIRVLFTARVFP